MDFRRELNRLADQGAQCEVINCGGTASIFRYEPLVEYPGNKRYFKEHPEECYVFEIGKDCGTVFSAKCVKEIRMTQFKYEIYLK